MARRSPLTRSLYRAARWSNTASAIASGDPRRITRRARNVVATALCVLSLVVVGCGSGPSSKPINTASVDKSITTAVQSGAATSYVNGFRALVPPFTSASSAYNNTVRHGPSTSSATDQAAATLAGASNTFADGLSALIPPDSARAMHSNLVRAVRALARDAAEVSSDIRNHRTAAARAAELRVRADGLNVGNLIEAVAKALSG
jgi:hypothetical protein